MSATHIDHRPTLGLSDRASIALTWMIPPTPNAKRPGLQLSRLQATLRTTRDASRAQARDRLVEPVTSFVDDIVVPVFRNDAVPLIALCVPEGVTGPEMIIRWPESLSYVAEGDTRHAVGTGVISGAVRFAWRDSVALFETGHVAFTVALLPMAGDTSSGFREANEYDLLLLQKLADPTEAVSLPPTESSTLLAALPCFALGEGKAGTIAQILETRLFFLRERPEGEHLRTLLAAAALTGDESPLRSAAIDQIAGVTVHINSARAEIDAIGAFHKTFRTTPTQSPEVRALAGLVQNILDFPHQDIAEIADSLDPVFDDSGVLMFNHPRILTEISVDSRSFSRMQGALGTCPYLLLTHLVVLYNERLLVDVESRLARLAYDDDADAIRVAPLAHLFGLLATVDGLIDDRVRARFAGSLRERLRVFRDLLFPYIPNAFRYRTERTLYDVLSTGRGLTLRRERFVQLLNQHERSVNDLHGLAKLSTDRRRDLMLFALALLTSLSVIKDFKEITGLSAIPAEVLYGAAWIVVVLVLVVTGFAGGVLGSAPGPLRPLFNNWWTRLKAGISRSSG